MRCYRKILRISYKDHVTNEKVRAKIQQAIGSHEDLSLVKRSKLQWYGQVSRSSGQAKTIFQGTVTVGRRQRRLTMSRVGTSDNGQGWSSQSPRGQWRTEKNGGNRLRGRLWCLKDSRGYGIGEGEGFFRVRISMEMMSKSEAGSCGQSAVFCRSCRQPHSFSISLPPAAMSGKQSLDLPKVCPTLSL